MFKWMGDNMNQLPQRIKYVDMHNLIVHKHAHPILSDLEKATDAEVLPETVMYQNHYYTTGTDGHYHLSPNPVQGLPRIYISVDGIDERLTPTPDNIPIRRTHI
jgi:hypothetical protein